MEEALYDALTPVLCIPILTAELSALLSKPTAAAGRQEEPENQQREQLLSHAEAFCSSLGRDHPQHEDEEERDKLGGLRQCTWTRLDNVGAGDNERHSAVQVGRRRKRNTQDDHNDDDDDDDDDGHTQIRGLSVSLLYEKDAFHFVIYTASPRSGLSRRSRIAAATDQRSTESREEPAIVLSKSSPAALKSFTKYILEVFALTVIYPFDPWPSLMQSTLENYLTIVCTGLPIDGGSGLQALQDHFSNIIGKIELTIGISHPIAKALKKVQVIIPASAFLTWYQPVEPSGGESRRPTNTFLRWVADLVKAKSGLALPVFFENDGLRTEQHDHSEGDDDNEDNDSPNALAASRDQHGYLTMRISRISTEAYVMSASGLKFKSRAVHAAAMASSDVDKDGENCVCLANRDLLLAIIDAARHDQQRWAGVT